MKSVNFVFVYGGKSVVNTVYANRFSGSLVSLVLVVLCSSVLWFAQSMVFVVLRPGVLVLL